MGDEDRFLTVPEVADRMRVTPYTVRKWLREGRIEGVMPGGTKGGYRISEAALRRFIAASTRPAKSA